MLFANNILNTNALSKPGPSQEYIALLFIMPHAGDERDKGCCLSFGSYVARRQDQRANVDL